MPMLWVEAQTTSPSDGLAPEVVPPADGIADDLPARPHAPRQGQGAAPEEIRVFATISCAAGTRCRAFLRQGAEAEACGRVRVPAPPDRAELCFTRDEGPWKERRWETAPATLDAGTRRISARVPGDARVAYLNLIASSNCLVSTEHVVRGADGSWE
jgi:hypothetical protein